MADKNTKGRKKKRGPKTLSGEQREIKKLSEKIDSLSSELRELRKSVVPREKIKETENDLYKEIRSLKNNLKDALKQISDNRESAENSAASLKKDISELRKLEEHVKKVDVIGVRRDIESLLARHKWLESRVDSIDLDGLIEKISELENIIITIKANTPLIIE